MASNLSIDDSLLVLTQNVAGLKRKTVNLALKDFVQRRKQQEVLDLFGTIDYDKDYDYKELRARNGWFSSIHRSGHLHCVNGSSQPPSSRASASSASLTRNYALR